MAFGAISTAIRAAIDKIRAVRAGRREVWTPAVIGGKPAPGSWSRYARFRLRI